ncbi:ADP-ribose glycohydrolase MACROD2 isoform X3 [Pimephales promelas]|uniref:ADP-ribose glycohydrolase MACROD2 isoform X3 n=1 Tax=Pimephales promelas TaxID=90988 RepID=UPI001955CF5F|nr:ADP-ribose glycohydrolase MACROD2 isoform X3 [Pimephales promelas]
MYRRSFVFFVVVLSRVDTKRSKANSSLLGGGGVDGCIHRAAGHLLYEECHSLNGCDTGKAKITCGYDLPAKYVIHTVGPIARGNLGQSQKDDLESCYTSSLKLMKDNNLRSVAFPCISTGIYGFPNEPAAEIALKTVHDWIVSNQDEIDRVIFCVFLETDYEIYKRKMSDFFSPDNDEHKKEDDAREEQGNTQPMEGDEEDEDDADKKDEKEDESMMSQTEESHVDEMMESQKPEAEGLDDEPMVQDNKTPAKEDHKVELSPTAKKKPEPEAEKEKKKEVKGGDPQIAGEEKEKEDSPEKKMLTGQTDEAGKLMEDPVTTAAKENNTSSTKVDVKAQDKSSQEPDSTPTDSRPNSQDGQGDESAQE